MKAPTHTKGHTLDLVITDAAPIKSQEVNNLGVSDHKLVSMAFTFSLSLIRPKCQISFRNWKQIDPTSITVDLQHNINCPVSATVDKLVDHYNTSLSSVFDLHAPIKKRGVKLERSAPLFTQERRQMKTKGRILEHCCKRSGLTVHKLAFRDHQKAYLKSLKGARSQYYSNLINKNIGN